MLKKHCPAFWCARYCWHMSSSSSFREN